jgi:protein TonB
MVQPEYPDSAQLAGEMGDVLLDVYVNANGKPRKFRIHKSSGYTDLDNAAAEAVAMWHYIPAIEGGDTTSDWMTVKVHFGPEQQAPQPTPASTTAPPAQH